MKKTELNEVIRNTPRWYPVFEVVRVPAWTKALLNPLRKGERVYLNDAGSFIRYTKFTHQKLALPAGAVKFHGYMSSDRLR